MKRILPGVLLIAALLLGAPEAVAGDSWTTPYPGIRYLYRTSSTPWRIHALVIDLCRAGVRLQATSSSQRKRTPSAFGALVGAEAVINGDFFSYSTYGTSGLAVSKGSKWSDTKDSSRPFIAFGPDRALIDPPSNTVSTVPPWITEAVGGNPNLIVDGIKQTSTSSLCTVRHPRTMAGLSRDGKTLYLAVVDGRWSASKGMTCGEMATLMAGLGAYNALNLDGGGSSSMWIKGKGTVNHPSDGKERTVGNHLAVHATGTGDPGSCDLTWEETHYMLGAAGAHGTSDVDGDGLADACARGPGGVTCYLGKSSLGKAVAGPELSDKTGWGDPNNLGTLRMGDIDGDGRADLCARANAGVYCWKGTASGLSKTSIKGPTLSDATGWYRAKYYTTIRLADVTGDGKDDLCARYSSGFRCHPSTGNGFSASVGGPDMSDKSGWGDPAYHGTIRMGDIDGDGRSDVCARGKNGVICWRATSKGFSPEIAGPKLTDSTGWWKMRYWSTLRLRDVTGDGKADLCMRAAAGFRCYPSTGAGFGTPFLLNDLSDALGWWRYKYYGSIRLGDITGDGRADLCARGIAGVTCWPITGKAFGKSLAGPVLPDKNGWDKYIYMRTIRLADVTGDNKADLCARSSTGLSCWISSGAGFPKSIKGPAWTNAAGWDKLMYYGSIAVAGPRCMPKTEVCDGKDNDCDGDVDEGGVCASKDGGSGPKKDLGGSGPNKDLGGGPNMDLGGVPRKDGTGFKTDGGFAPLDEEGCSCRWGGSQAPTDLTLIGFLLLAAWWRRRR